MRVVVDAAVCTGHGRCYVLAPDVFSPDALRAFYALPESDASKGLADYRMLVRKLPPELFAGVRTMAHDLFGAQDVEIHGGQ